MQIKHKNDDKIGNGSQKMELCTEFGKMNDDLMISEMSKRDVMNKFNHGGYDIPDKWYKRK